jgi:hypothetical protein
VSSGRFVASIHAQTATGGNTGMSSGTVRTWVLWRKSDNAITMRTLPMLRMRMGHAMDKRMVSPLLNRTSTHQSYRSEIPLTQEAVTACHALGPSRQLGDWRDRPDLVLDHYTTAIMEERQL